MGISVFLKGRNIMKILIPAALVAAFFMPAALAQTRPNHTLPQFEKLAPKPTSTQTTQAPESDK